MTLFSKEKLEYFLLILNKTGSVCQSHIILAFLIIIIKHKDFSQKLRC